MKVTIGPYKDDESPRKVEVVIHDYDTWNMDHTLALIILPMLKQLKGQKHGSPIVDNEDVPVHLQMPKDWYETKYLKDGETDPHFFDRWDYVMDQMIWSFQHEVDDDWEEAFYPDFPDEEAGVAVRELEFKGIGPAQLLLFPDEEGRTEEYELYEMVRSETESRFDKKKYEQYQKRLAEGFRLFGKYYQSLWD